MHRECLLACSVGAPHMESHPYYLSTFHTCTVLSIKVKCQNEIFLNKGKYSIIFVFKFRSLVLYSLQPASVVWSHFTYYWTNFRKVIFSCQTWLRSVGQNSITMCIDPDVHLLLQALCVRPGQSRAWCLDYVPPRLKLTGASLLAACHGGIVEVLHAEGSFSLRTPFVLF